MGIKHELTKTMVREAMREIKEGRTEDALLTLDRAVNPKFASHAECVKALQGVRKHMRMTA